ncbi:MAG: hypothetical protein NVSMB42_22170 [Herpetosiphon sp.]
MKKYLDVLKKAVSEWSADNCLRLGASTAYYTMTSLFPLLLVVVAITSFVLARTSAGQNMRQQLVTGITRSVNSGGSGSGASDQTFQKALSDGLTNASEKTASKGLISSLIGFVVLLFTASGVFTELDAAFNIIWKVPASAQASGIKAFLRQKSLSFALVIGVAFLLLVATILNTALATLTKYLPFAVLWVLVGQVVQIGLTTLVFALLFKFLPETEVEWSDVWSGAFFTSILWTVGQVILSIYFKTVGSSNPAYGIIGGVLAFLLYIYYSSQILFFGAEFTQVYAHQYGSRQPKAQTQTEPAMTKPAAVMVATAYTAAKSAHDAEIAALKVQRVAAATTGGIVGLIGGALIGGAGLVIGLSRGVRRLRGR